MFSSDNYRTHLNFILPANYYKLVDYARNMQERMEDTKTKQLNFKLMLDIPKQNEVQVGIPCEILRWGWALVGFTKVKINISG